MKYDLRALCATTIALGGMVAVLTSASAQVSGGPVQAVTQGTPEAQTVAMPRGVVEAASAYETYMSRAAAISDGFTDGGSVLKAMNVGEAYHIKQINEGMIAYAAMVALHDPAFVQGVRDAAGGPEQQAQLASQLSSEPWGVTVIPGAHSAALLVQASLRSQGDHLFGVGKAVKQSAYTVQHQSWSIQKVPDAAARLAAAKAMAEVKYSPTADDTARLVKVSSTPIDAASATDAGDEIYTPVIRRALALAALSIMGKADDSDQVQLAHVLTEKSAGDCMSMAKLNLYQCLAVAGPHYEDIFCLGQHALMDTGTCVAKAATPRVSKPMPAAAIMASAAAPASTAMLIPVANGASSPMKLAQAGK